MTDRTRRGGRRQPANPAPVSGPGALSRRTDGGPGSDTQPIREMPAEATGGYGTRQAHTAMQGAAPMAGTPRSPIEQLIPGGDAIFAPTSRPDEPQTTGLVSEPSLLPDDPDAVVRALFSIYPHPHLLKLMRGS